MKNYQKLEIPSDSAWERKSIRRFLPIFIKDFFDGCKNLIKWAPTIWKQRDWDSSFIFDILEKKIEFQRKELVSSNRHTRIEIDNRDMTIALNLIQRVREGYYECEYIDYHKCEYYFKPVEGKEGVSTFESNVISERYQEFLDKYPSTIRKIIEKEKDLDLEDKGKLCFYVSMYNQEKANSLLFKILEERIGYWWD